MVEVSLVKSPLDKCYWTLLVVIQHGSGNGLVPPGTKPLPEPMLTQFYVTIYGVTMPQIKARNTPIFCFHGLSKPLSSHADGKRCNQPDHEIRPGDVEVVTATIWTSDECQYLYIE